jgi:CxxC motif-containing protein (DUF1111 family)
MKRTTLSFGNVVLSGTLVAMGGLIVSALIPGGKSAQAGDDNNVAPYAIGAPLPGLDPSLVQLFEDGKKSFTHSFTPAEGLGPVFNAASCVTCHAAGGTGGGDPVGVGSPFNVTRFAYINDGVFDPIRDLGGQVLAIKSIKDNGVPDCTISGETLPPIANAISIRNTPPVFGFGLLDAIADSEILRRQNIGIDGIHGFANWGIELQAVDQTAIPGFPMSPYGPVRVGRFGWKAQTATLFQFSAEPLNAELGVSSPFFPQEHSPTGSKLAALLPPTCNVATNAVNDPNNVVSTNLYHFQALLAPPPTLPKGDVARAGERIFRQLGCQHCHTEAMVTGPRYNLLLADGSTVRVPQLESQIVHAYSDLLVHFMGDALSDGNGVNMGVVNGRAAGRYWRTTPLWGFRFKESYLHDGRTGDTAEAILAHGGEGQASRDRFASLTPPDRAALIAFLNTL